MGKPRGTETMGDLIRSLAVLIAIVLAVFLLLPRHHHNPVHTIDYSTDLGSARHAAGYHVLAPVGLRANWRATSARVDHVQGHVEFHLGFVTPKNQYAELEETDADVSAFVQTELGHGTQQLGDVTVQQTQWQQLRTAKGELALLRVSGEPSIIVTGSASLHELQTLAASLQ